MQKGRKPEEAGTDSSRTGQEASAQFGAAEIDASGCAIATCESVSLEVKALLALVAETKRAGGAPKSCPSAFPSGTPEDAEQTAPSIDLDMAATPLDSDDDDMEESGVGPWRTVASNQKKRNKVVMKLKGTPATS